MTVYERARVSVCPEAVMACLPPRLEAELSRQAVIGHVEELRLRRGGGSEICALGTSVTLRTVLTGEEMEAILVALCQGSMYAHQETLRQGYMVMRGGIRVGVCGRMRTEGCRVLGIGEISSLVFRFPRYIDLPTEEICRLLCRVHPGRGVLIYSPPGVGKTSLLRALIRALTNPPHAFRLAVIDTREELSACGTVEAARADWLSGYPRAQGIEIATRTLNPQLILCDEIGEVAEAEAIRDACNAGVPLVATAHGDAAASLLRRQGLRCLHESAVFGSYVGLSRDGGGLRQRVTLAEDAWRSR